MGNMDLAEKVLERHGDVFADIINVLVFRGERFLEPSNLTDGPSATHYKDEEGALRQQERDVVKHSFCGPFPAVWGIENQSRVDADMVFRVMGYDYASYRGQLDSRRRRGAENGRSCGRKGRKRPLRPVITLVLHFGTEQRWGGPFTAAGALELSGLPEKEGLAALISNPHINVVDVAFLPPEVRARFQSDFRVVAEYFSAVREGRFEEFRKNRYEICHPEELLHFLRVFSGDERFDTMLSAAAEMKEKGEMTMCKIWDYVEAQGMEKGKKEIALEMLRHREPDEKIMRYSRLSRKQIHELKRTLSGEGSPEKDCRKKETGGHRREQR